MIVMIKSLENKTAIQCLKIHPVSLCFDWTGRGPPLPGPSRTAGPLSGPGPGDDCLQPSGLS